MYYVECGKVDKGIEYINRIYKNNFYKERIDKYINSKGLCMSQFNL